MHIEIPDLTSQQVGQLIGQLVHQAQAPGSAATQVLALMHVAAALASGQSVIVAAGAHDEPMHG